MKIWKMVGCLGLLVVIICSCVILANPTEVSAMENDEKKESSAQGGAEEQESAQISVEQTVTVEKSYSTGLTFRSNGDGSCAVSGLGSCNDSYLLIPPKSPGGDVVMQILPGALASSTVTAIEIPAGVTELSADVFAGCTRLVHVRIAAGNHRFSVQDGVLYTADGQTLLYCPVARNAKELTLDLSLKRIAAGAFAQCPSLATIYYAGNTSDWRSIQIGDDNDALYEAAFKFNAN